MQYEHSGDLAHDRLTLFDDRYGVGAFERLIGLLEQPCVSFATIATRFGVTRERVRQWHLQFLPDAPRGHERRSLCRMQQARRRLLSDPLFKDFYRHARGHFAPEEINLIRTREGLRMRAALINGQLVTVKRARLRPGRRAGSGAVYVLSACRSASAFVYYRLDSGDFLFVPCAELPETGTTFLDSPGSRFRRYRNTFAAATPAAAAR